MLKQLIIGLAIISVVAMLWPAASAQAQCTGWVQGKDPASPTKWCYWCPTGWTNVSGAWVQTGYCLAWWGSSVWNAVEFKAPPGANTCDPALSECPVVISAVYGRFDVGSGCTENVLDPDCGIEVIQLCCPPGHKNDQYCTPPNASEPGQPGINLGYEVSGKVLTDCTTRNCKAQLEVKFEEITCPNKNWGEHVIPYNFNGLTCVCPLGFEWRNDKGSYWCCRSRDKTTGLCNWQWSTDTTDPNNPKQIYASATALWCKFDPNTYTVGQTVTFGPPDGTDPGKCYELGPTAVPGGECEALYEKLYPH